MSIVFQFFFVCCCLGSAFSHPCGTFKRVAEAQGAEEIAVQLQISISGLDAIFQTPSNLPSNAVLTLQYDGRVISSRSLSPSQDNNNKNIIIPLGPFNANFIYIQGSVVAGEGGKMLYFMESCETFGKNDAVFEFADVFGKWSMADAPDLPLSFSHETHDSFVHKNVFVIAKLKGIKATTLHVFIDDSPHSQTTISESEEKIFLGQLPPGVYVVSVTATEDGGAANSHLDGDDSSVIVAAMGVAILTIPNLPHQVCAPVLSLERKQQNQNQQQAQYAPYLIPHGVRQEIWQSCFNRMQPLSRFIPTSSDGANWIADTGLISCRVAMEAQYFHRNDPHPRLEKARQMAKNLGLIGKEEQSCALSSSSSSSCITTSDESAYEEELVRNVRVLAFSEHGGTIKDFLQQLRSSGLSPSNIHCFASRYYRFILDEVDNDNNDNNTKTCVRPDFDAEMTAFLTKILRHIWQEGYPEWTVVPDGEFVAEFAALFGERLRQDYDVIIVGMPSIYAALIQAVAPDKMWIRIAHRFDHETGVGSIQREVVRDLVAKNDYVFAASHYDVVYSEYYSCRSPVLWRYLFSRVHEKMAGQYDAVTKSKPVFLLWGGASGVMYKSIRRLFDFLLEKNDNSSSNNNGFEIITVKDYMQREFPPEKKSKFDSMMDFVDILGIVYFPYSLLSGVFHELYATGIPLLAPSVAYIKEDYRIGLGIDHHSPNNFHCYTPSFADRCDGDGNGEKSNNNNNKSNDGSHRSFNYSLPDTDPNGCDPKTLDDWFDWIDIGTWPHLQQFDTPEQAMDLMQQMAAPEQRSRLNEISASMSKHSQSVLEDNRGIIRRNLRKMLEKEWGRW